MRAEAAIFASIFTDRRASSASYGPIYSGWNSVTAAAGGGRFRCDSLPLVENDFVFLLD